MRILENIRNIRNSIDIWEWVWYNMGKINLEKGDMCMGVIVLTGKSCVGKDSTREELEKYNFNNIVSYTSRPARINETNGIDYHFVERDTFEQMINNNEMIEHREYNTLFLNKPDTWYYGLRKDTLDPNKKYVVILDLEGTENFIKYYGKKNCFVVYMCCPKSERERRAIDRGSFDKTEWNRRLLADDRSFKSKKLKKLIDFTVVNMSDDIEDLPRIAKILNRMYTQKFDKE